MSATLPTCCWLDSLSTIVCSSQTLFVARSADGDLTHVDGDQQRLRDELVVTLPSVDPPLGGDDDPVYFAIVGGIVQSGCAAQDIDGVVLTAQQPVGAEARDLFARVG